MKHILLFHRMILRHAETENTKQLFYLSISLCYDKHIGRRVGC